MSVTESFHVNLNAFHFQLCCGLGSASVVRRRWIRACRTCRGELHRSGVPGGSPQVLLSPYTLIVKGKGPVWFRLRCLVWFFLIAENIYSSRAVNNELVFLSSNQLSKSWRGDLYSWSISEYFWGKGGEQGTAFSLQPQWLAALGLHCSPASLPAQFSLGWNDLSWVKGFFFFLF